MSITPSLVPLVGRPVEHVFPDRHHLFPRPGTHSLCGEVIWAEVQLVPAADEGEARWVCASCRGIAKGLEELE